MGPLGTWRRAESSKKKQDLVRRCGRQAEVILVWSNRTDRIDLNDLIDSRDLLGANKFFKSQRVADGKSLGENLEMKKKQSRKQKHIDLLIVRYE